MERQRVAAFASMTLPSNRTADRRRWSAPAGLEPRSDCTGRNPADMMARAHDNLTAHGGDG
jgi:hypothetical protein